MRTTLEVSFAQSSTIPYLYAHAHDLPTAAPVGALFTGARTRPQAHHAGDDQAGGVGAL